MKVPSGMASRTHRVVCPFCESGELASLGPGFARCGTCAMPLLGSTLETLREIVGLPDALGSHPCECGHPEMRRLPDGVFHCPACGAEILPVQIPTDPKCRRLGCAPAWGEVAVPPSDACTPLRNHGKRR